MVKLNLNPKMNQKQLSIDVLFTICKYKKSKSKAYAKNGWKRRAPEIDRIPNECVNFPKITIINILSKRFWSSNHNMFWSLNIPYRPSSLYSNSSQLHFVHFSGWSSHTSRDFSWMKWGSYPMHPILCSDLFMFPCDYS